MNILIVASLTAPATANYLIRAMRDAGHRVFACSDVPSALADLLIQGAVDVAAISDQYRLQPDLLLFLEGGSMLLFPVGLERLPCITAWYGIDTHMDYEKHLRISRLFDVTFIAQKEFVSKLHADGVPQAYWLPLAFAPEMVPAQLPPKSIAVSHVGSANVSANPLRHELLSALRKHFSPTQLGPAPPEEIGAIYSASRIVFNRSVRNDVNMRYFEAAGSGAVLVTDRVIDNGVEELMEEGVHYVTYSDEASLLKVVQDLLADDERCEAMGRRARAHVLSGHTYGHRVEALVETVASARKGRSPRFEDYFAACLSVGLLAASLRSVALALRSQAGGRYRRLAGRGAAFIVQGVAAMLHAAERTMGKKRQ